MVEGIIIMKLKKPEPTQEGLNMFSLEADNQKKMMT